MTDTEKMLAWLDYAIQENSSQYIKTEDDYWNGRMVAYRIVKERLVSGNFEIPFGGDHD